jgi:hypothetical protein
MPIPSRDPDHKAIDQSDRAGQGVEIGRRLIAHQQDPILGLPYGGDGGVGNGAGPASVAPGILQDGKGLAQITEKLFRFRAGKIYVKGKEMSREKCPALAFPLPNGVQSFDFSEYKHLKLKSLTIRPSKINMSPAQNDFLQIPRRMIPALHRLLHRL